ncbi:MAG: DUF169 domain-containing protein [Oscillospiraceae bacterium]|nr:DUF169 domain-containing protein [Oscillospiraceae bacterium]
MIDSASKKAFAELGCTYRPVALKFCYSRPEGIPHEEKVLSFCQFVKLCQDSGESFYIDKDNDNCFGRMVLGMMPKQPFTASGQAGMDFGIYRTPAPNARIHNTIPTLIEGSVNFVIFSPVESCDFDPDIVIVVADTEQADIVMRATSYISGDFWESKTSCVFSCGWTYVYPYLTGKVNFCVTGMHHGMARRKVYPKGLHIIAIPYQKLDEVCTALKEMPWRLPALQEDEESRRIMAERMAKWAEMQANSGGEVPPAQV